MSDDPVYMCPDCGFNELKIQGEGLKGPDGESLATAECPHCAWEGPLSSTIGVLTTERLWTSKAIGDLMIRLVSRHAAGPMVQAYEFIGLLPQKRDAHAECPEGATPSEEDLKAVAEHNDLAQACRNHVMKAVFAAAVEAGFTAAEEANRFYATKTNTPLHHVLREEEAESGTERKFGGDVVPIDKKSRK